MMANRYLSEQQLCTWRCKLRKYIDRLSDKQCFMIVAFLVGIFGMPALLLALNIAEWLIGEAQMGLISCIFLGYMVYRVLHEINPDNDEDQDEEEYFA
jgi:hypothetical protein